MTATPNVLILLPAKARQVAYIAFGLASLADGSMLVGYAAAGFDLPVWLVVATAVVAYLAVPFSALAASNVSKQRPDPPTFEPLPDVPHAEHLRAPRDQAAGLD